MASVLAIRSLGQPCGWFDERGRGQPSTSFRQNVLRALEAVQEDLHDSEFLFAHSDDKHVATTPHRVGDVTVSKRTREAAHWASWSDTLPMIHARHPVVANLRATSGRRFMVAQFVSCQPSGD